MNDIISFAWSFLASFIANLIFELWKGNRKGGE